MQKFHFIINNSEENGLWLQTFLSRKKLRISLLFSTWINNNDFISLQASVSFVSDWKKMIKTLQTKIVCHKMFNFFLQTTHKKSISIAFCSLSIYFLWKRQRKLIENLCQRKMLQLIADQTKRQCLDLFQQNIVSKEFHS